MVEEIKRCRLCGDPGLVSVLDLGRQALTGIFPRTREERVTEGPLELVKCHGGAGSCGLVQLRHNYDSSEMYGDNYGYRSGLNRSMVEHLSAKVHDLMSRVTLAADDLVLDIGSNDGTTLGFYPADGPTLVGIDPTSRKFLEYYKPHIRAIPDLFGASVLRREYGPRKAKIVTSIAMFYDLERPMEFVSDVASVLADDGIWHFEQSYLPSMLAANSYDTVCHEHLEYYALRQVIWMCERAGLKILDVQLNDVNGGSFAVTAAKAGAPYDPNRVALDAALQLEASMGIETLRPWESFGRDVARHREDLRRTLGDIRERGELVLGYGASTKGNVVLQYCGLTPDDLPAIAEVNEDKFGRFTPGTRIPIVSEAEARARRPAYFLVLPWHFRENLVRRERAYLEAGGRMIFPLPRIEVVSR